MLAPTTNFQLEVTASRLDKGLLAIPRRYCSLFPSERREILVLFDEGKKPMPKAFLPYDAKIKECRIFGLARWFAKRKIAAGDIINISLENADNFVYRIVADRGLKRRQQQATRRKLFAASTDAEAEAHLVELANLSQEKCALTARRELLQLAEKTSVEPRRRTTKSRSDPYEGVPPAMRLLLTQLHQGKCQLCSFTFSKRDGKPYFEIHHLDPHLGHHPMNLLVVCGNCHAQLEHAQVRNFEVNEGWLVGVTINGVGLTVRQPFLQDPRAPGTMRILALLFAFHLAHGVFQLAL